MTTGANEIGEISMYHYNGLGHLVGQTMIVKKNAYGYINVSDITLLKSYEDFLIQYATEIEAKARDVLGPQTLGGGGPQFPPPGGGGPNPITLGEDLTDVQPLRFVLDPDIGLETGSVKYRFSQSLLASAGNGSNVNQTSTVYKDFVIDYTSPLKNTIMETESGAGSLTYRYVYGLDKLSVYVSPISNGAGSIAQNGAIKLWYHHDRLGSTDFLTDNVQGKAVSYVTYDDWGAPTMKAILKVGVRELDLVTEYTGHPYDPILGVYYARARMYDASDRRFMAVDWVRGSILNPQMLGQYTYVLDNPQKYVDIFGEMPVRLLNLIKLAYIGGAISNEHIGMVVIAANVASLSTDFLNKIATILTLDLRNIYEWFAETELELKDSDVSKQQIYISFHEIAQILAAKQIYTDYPELSNIIQPFPQLEKIVTHEWSIREIDIAFGGYAWEVKPYYTSDSAWEKSLSKYVKDYYPDKLPENYDTSWNWSMPGIYVNSTSALLFSYDGYSAYIHVQWKGYGKVGYFFSYRCTTDTYYTREYNSRIIAEKLLPAFKYAELANDVTKLVAAVVALVASMITPIPEEIIVGPATAAAVTDVVSAMMDIIGKAA